MNVPFPSRVPMPRWGDLLNREIHPMKEITTLGIDLAKNVFSYTAWTGTVKLCRKGTSDGYARRGPRGLCLQGVG
jgi:hypothetical protein